MKKILMILAIAVFAANGGKAQGPASPGTPDSVVYGYYYCFALFGGGTVYFTPVFREPQGETTVYPLIEQSWQDYVGTVLNLPHYVAIVTGPFIDSDNAIQDRQAWLSSLPDSISTAEVQYTYGQPNQ